MESLKQLNDLQVAEKLFALRAKEKELVVEILDYLAEVEERKLHLVQGYGSLFQFCVAKLSYSESGAFRRIAAARCLRSFPEIRQLGV